MDRLAHEQAAQRFKKEYVIMLKKVLCYIVVLCVVLFCAQMLSCMHLFCFSLVLVKATLIRTTDARVVCSFVFTLPFSN